MFLKAPPPWSFVIIIPHHSFFSPSQRFFSVPTYGGEGTATGTRDLEEEEEEEIVTWFLVW